MIKLNWRNSDLQSINTDEAIIYLLFIFAVPWHAKIRYLSSGSSRRNVMMKKLESDYNYRQKRKHDLDFS